MSSPRGLRSLAAAATALALTAGVASAVTATAAPTTYSTTDAKVAVVDGPQHEHHATLDTRTYVPRAATAAHPVPALLITHGFGGSKTDSDVVRWADFFARHGYLVATYTSQGFGASSGCIRLDSYAYDVRDASDLITKLIAGRRDVTHDAKGPLVGMIGVSYSGGLLPLVAEFDPRVRAIVPTWAWNSLQHALIPNDWVPAGTSPYDLQTTTNGVPKAQWTALLYAAGNSQPFSGNGGCLQEKQVNGDPSAAYCPGFPAQMCQSFTTIAATGSLDAATMRLLRESSGATWITRLRTPTMFVQGEPDTLFNLDEAIATYTALRNHHTPAKMIWVSSGHGGYSAQPGEGEAAGGSTDLDHGYVSLNARAWFDHYLKGARVSTGPGFEFYEPWRANDGTGSDYEQFGAANAFPAQRGARFLLSGNSVMVPPGLSPSPGSTTFARLGVPSYSETADCTGPAAGPPCPPDLRQVPPTDVAAESVDWTSPPVAADVLSVGMPTAHLHVSHALGTDVIFFAKVYDVAPDGSATLVNRLVAPVRIPNAALAKAVDIRLPAFAWRFAKGHSVRFTLTASDAAYDIGVTTNVPDVVTIAFGNPPPPAGATPYQQIKALQPNADDSAFILPVDDPQRTEPFYPIR